MKKVLLIALGCFGLLVSCSKDNSSPYIPNCNGAAKSYSTDVAPVVQSACVSCHQNYSSYSSVYSSRNSIRSMVASGQMPQGKSLSNEDKDKILCWIDNGAPNN